MSSSRGAHKGLFIDGVWHCDCSPRLPTVHLQTSKPGPNHGRWFRTCNKPPREQCKFFLWDDDARTREDEAVANTAAILTSGHKRKRSVSGNLDKYHSSKAPDDHDLGEAMSHLETPGKAAKTTTFSTPATRRSNLPWDESQSSDTAVFGLQTPHTGRKAKGDPFISRPSAAASPFPSSAASQESIRRVATSYSTPYTSIDETPKTSRFKNSMDRDLVGDVFGLLQDSKVGLPVHTEEELRALLTRHAKRTEGFKRARDVTRLAVKAKDAKITEFTYRIGTLEAELEAEKAMVTHLQWEAQNQTSDID
ncbi:hypothetical protein COCC4DRAFT_34058 [Bipolaris maydis ATCC 48331]|uniref:GRF-type domain-containing protein n=2 Tax=Cochliobolus heterostrophus TaxID=5016 RepID=M2ULL3_COCH5|nr:uncharacterized protein COCC4DRAFT_34058 [Bipolaris maydis ATCC 48331]EMD94506.1 hypothetical protein COCHEDRAFT_1020404 [Bipolaris maydis C5]KAJ5026359.1 hypothetical protein J3E73DRAFT_305350 [Bipolaris maydis]ENI01151.1 hypothetical protein COCC4DRAFT_34058 [Bipolaris maydis ATCC 48331]KAJ5059921.1 hypothetical protein J3E74DRAFT_351727 [Bipolaris maydis]KAJ6197112.1 hypothetical protein J3E72DRAFT_320475 [Bipolaris maydis]